MKTVISGKDANNVATLSPPLTVMQRKVGITQIFYKQVCQKLVVGYNCTIGVLITVQAHLINWNSKARRLMLT